MAKKRKRKSDGQPEAPDVIKGEEVPASKLAIVFMFFGGLALFFGFGFLMFDSLLLGMLPFRLSWWGWILSVIMFFCGVIFILSAPFEMFFPKRLILGKRAFQLVRKTSSGDVVKLHIPYLNIDHVAYEKVGEEKLLVIDFEDPDDEELYSADLSELDQRKNKGFDFTMSGSFTPGLSEVADMLKKKVRKARKEAEAAEQELEIDED